MNTVEVLILLGLIIFLIYASHKKKKEEYNNEVERIKQFKIDCARNSNRRILNDYGEEKFEYWYGKEQLEKVKSGRDTELVEMIKR
jgi:hypothetical protein